MSAYNLIIIVGLKEYDGILGSYILVKIRK